MGKQAHECLTGQGGGGGGRGRGGDRGVADVVLEPGQTFKGLVRWESAQPVLEAAKAALPDAFANRYVISVSGFPIGDIVSVDGLPKLSGRDLERIRAASYLAPKGRYISQARIAQVVGGAVLLGFSKRAIQLSPPDREITFATTISRLPIKAKFNFREMMYRGTLAI